MFGGVLPSLTQITISQVPTSAEVGVQLRTLPACQFGVDGLGIQAVVPDLRRNKSIWVVDATPPLAVAVQVMGVPAVAYCGLPVPVTASGATTWTAPAL